MATRAFVLRHEDLAPTATNGEFVLRSSVALVQDQVGGAIVAEVFTTFLYSDTVATIGTKVAAAVRAHVATRAGMGTVATNDVIMPSYTKG